MYDLSIFPGPHTRKALLLKHPEICLYMVIFSQIRFNSPSSYSNNTKRNFSKGDEAGTELVSYK